MRAGVEARRLPHSQSRVAPVVTVSGGVASRLPSAGDDAVVLVADADQALYRAKAAGRNRIDYDDPRVPISPACTRSGSCRLNPTTPLAP